MKYLMQAMIVMAAIAAPAFAKIVDGCEIVQVEGANYFAKVDPGCAFASFPKSDKDDRKAAAEEAAEEAFGS